MTLQYEVIPPNATLDLCAGTLGALERILSMHGERLAKKRNADGDRKRRSSHNGIVFLVADSDIEIDIHCDNAENIHVAMRMNESADFRRVRGNAEVNTGDDESASLQRAD